MCVAFLIAAFSFFLGKQQHFPAAIRGSQILNLPMILILVTMIYWLIRLRVSTLFKKALEASGGDRGLTVHQPVAGGNLREQ
jgi:hypothetical protein